MPCFVPSVHHIYTARVLGNRLKSSTFVGRRCVSKSGVATDSIDDVAEFVISLNAEQLDKNT
jgi:hypothetical protein